MKTAKQEALNIIQQLPDNADTEEIIYRLYVLENIRRGQQDAAIGKTHSVEEIYTQTESDKTLEESSKVSKHGHNHSFHSTVLTTATTTMSTDSICTKFLLGTG